MHRGRCENSFASTWRCFAPHPALSNDPLEWKNSLRRRQLRGDEPQHRVATTAYLEREWCLLVEGAHRHCLALSPQGGMPLLVEPIQDDRVVLHDANVAKVEEGEFEALPPVDLAGRDHREDADEDNDGDAVVRGVPNERVPVELEGALYEEDTLVGELNTPML